LRGQALAILLNLKRVHYEVVPGKTVLLESERRDLKPSQMGADARSVLNVLYQTKEQVRYFFVAYSG
jgi:hypothetical protein